MALAIIGGLLLLFTGSLVLVAVFGTKPDPNEDENGKIRHMYPDDDPEYTVGEDNTPDWKIGKVRNN